MKLSIMFHSFSDGLSPLQVLPTFVAGHLAYEVGLGYSVKGDVGTYNNQHSSESDFCVADSEVLWDPDSDPGAWGGQWTNTTCMDNLCSSGKTGTKLISANVAHTASCNTTTYTNYSTS